MIWFNFILPNVIWRRCYWAIGAPFWIGQKNIIQVTKVTTGAHILTISLHQYLRPVAPRFVALFAILILLLQNNFIFPNSARFKTFIKLLLFLKSTKRSLYHVSFFLVKLGFSRTGLFFKAVKSSLVSLMQLPSTQ